MSTLSSLASSATLCASCSLARMRPFRMAALRIYGRRDRSRSLWRGRWKLNLVEQLQDACSARDPLVVVEGDFGRDAKVCPACELPADHPGRAAQRRHAVCLRGIIAHYTHIDACVPQIARDFGAGHSDKAEPRVFQIALQHAAYFMDQQVLYLLL